MDLKLAEIAKTEGAKAALDDIEKEHAKSAEIDITTDGVVEGDINVTGWKGLTFTGFVKAPVKSLKQVVGGLRISKKW